MHYVNEGPLKRRRTNMRECVCLNVGREGGGIEELSFFRRAEECQHDARGPSRGFYQAGCSLDTGAQATPQTGPHT